MNNIVLAPPTSFYFAASPSLILSVFAVITLLQGVYLKVGSPRACKITGHLAVALALVSCFVFMGPNFDNYLSGSYVAETLSFVGQVLILFIALCTLMLFSYSHLSDLFFRGEILSLFIMVVLGMLVLVSANELISVFVGLELASIGIYTLVGYIKPTQASREGAVKYYVLGSFASAILLFGFALLFAASGTMNIPEIVTSISKIADNSIVQLGCLLTMVGFAFKLALAPFHLWAPDAYEASPTGLTSFMATAVKVMVVIVMLRFLAQGMDALSSVWLMFFMFVAIASTITGNLLALVQTSLKRMLAYSSVAHAGYMAIALCAINAKNPTLPIASVIFYLISYSVVSLGAFAILMWLESEHNENIQLADLDGLAQKYPKASFGMAVFMFSFAGIPPSAGFMGKFFVFSAALNEQLYTLVVIGFLGAVISLYYYLRVIVRMYMFNPPAVPTSKFSENQRWFFPSFVTVSIILTLLLGTVAPNALMRVAKQASAVLVNQP